MRRPWTVRRTRQPHRDGQQRWDWAYQQLLAGTGAGKPAADPTVPRKPSLQEVRRESRNLCTGLDATTGADPKH